jgi:hypothetical protein
LLNAERALEHRVDYMNHTTAPDHSLGLGDGVILWRLSLDGRPDIWCLIFELATGWHLVLDDDPTGTSPYTLAEHHRDVVAVADRAEALKRCLLLCDWKEIDVE